MGWFLYDASGAHRGPLAAEALVAAIQAGDIDENAFVAAEQWFESPGTPGWHPASEVPELARLLAEARSGTLRIVEGAFKSNARGAPEFGATVMMVGNITPTNRNDGD